MSERTHLIRGRCCWVVNQNPGLLLLFWEWTFHLDVIGGCYHRSSLASRGTSIDVAVGFEAVDCSSHTSRRSGTFFTVVALDWQSLFSLSPLQEGILFMNYLNESPSVTFSLIRLYWGWHPIITTWPLRPDLFQPVIKLLFIFPPMAFLQKYV